MHQSPKIGAKRLLRRSLYAKFHRNLFIFYKQNATRANTSAKGADLTKCLLTVKQTPGENGAESYPARDTRPYSVSLGMIRSCAVEC